MGCIVLSELITLCVIGVISDKPKLVSVKRKLATQIETCKQLKAYSFLRNCYAHFKDKSWDAQM